MVTAIERLCKLLDKCGADYRVSATGYSIDIGPYTTAYANRSDTMLDVSLRQVTPEQAIAATLGAGTCKAIDTGYATAVCSECGAEYMGSIMTNEPPDYVKPLVRCPNCGRKVVDE